MQRKFFALMLICLSFAYLAHADSFDDAKFFIKLQECRDFCARQNPNKDALQTCKVLEERKLVVTDCEADCVKLPKDEMEKAKICQCLEDKCKTTPVEQQPKNGSTILGEDVSILIHVICFLIYTYALLR